jgi:hypothetical protein
MRRLRRVVRAPPDGFRPSPWDREAVQPDVGRVDASTDRGAPRRGLEVRRGLRQLPSAPHPRAPCRGTGAAVRSLALHRHEARILAPTSPDVGSHSRCALHGLWTAIPTVRHGLRPSEPGLEAVGRHTHDRSRGHGPNIGRGCGVRYRVRELPSASNLPKKIDRCGAGVAQLVERRPSKPQVAGSSPVSRSSSPYGWIATPRRAPAGRLPLRRLPPLPTAGGQGAPRGPATRRGRRPMRTVPTTPS